MADKPREPLHRLLRHIRSPHLPAVSPGAVRATARDKSGIQLAVVSAVDAGGDQFDEAFESGYPTGIPWPLSVPDVAEPCQSTQERRTTLTGEMTFPLISAVAGPGIR